MVSAGVLIGLYDNDTNCLIRATNHEICSCTKYAWVCMHVCETYFHTSDSKGGYQC